MELKVAENTIENEKLKEGWKRREVIEAHEESDSE